MLQITPRFNFIHLLKTDFRLFNCHLYDILFLDFSYLKVFNPSFFIF